ncbi:TPA: hypothetical protein N0F65_006401 [Lagenidium giganteum]|uniref:Transmembrane and coiled-coil domain-containing protein 4 n=1 Tax=Lagenidium giganteum TaxID=4803 RepID=A0AAV2YR21_9STRA|nr:TPA: hypothetical protein N0F65_006401 [Lagenidium giganteum]
MRDLLGALPKLPGTKSSPAAPAEEPQQAVEDSDEFAMNISSDFLSPSQKRGVAGLCACLLPHVNDTSSERKWSQTFLQMIVEVFLSLPSTQVEAFLPMLQVRDNALLEFAATANCDGDGGQAATVIEAVDPEPFLSLLAVEENDANDQQGERDDASDNQGVPYSAFHVKVMKHMLWFTVKAIGYDARARTLFRHLADEMSIPWVLVMAEEMDIGRALFAEAISMTMDKVEVKRNLWDWKRNVKIGAAAVTGGALLALTGGIAAPAIAMSLSALGGAGAVIGTAVGSAAGVTATTVLFGTAGAGVIGMKADTRTRGVHQFKFDLVTSGDGMNVYICVSGWLDEDDAPAIGVRRSWGDSREYLRAFYRRRNPEKVDQVDQVLDRYKGREDEFYTILRKTYRIQEGSATVDPLGMRPNVAGPSAEDERATGPEADELQRAWRWKDRFPQGDQYCLLWEEELLRQFGKSMRSFAREQVVQFGSNELISYTAFAALFTAVAVPRTIMRMADMIDNTWVIVMNRADESGKILADSLSRREQGLRPVTLVGYGMGARLIFSCLKELAAKGEECLGIVENAVLLGSPVPAVSDEWKRVRSVVSNRLINGYSENDWMLAIMYRYQGWALNSAGIGPLDVAGVENVDLTSIVRGHMEYKNKIGAILDLLKLEE